jgi:general secretion pathway protein B
MSYILDSLKKSEQERLQGEVPDLRTLHVPSTPRSRKKTIWAPLLLAALLLNACLLVWWLRPWQSAEPVPVAATEPQVAAPAPALPGQPEERPVATPAPAAVVPGFDVQSQAQPERRQALAETSPASAAPSTAAAAPVAKAETPPTVPVEETASPLPPKAGIREETAARPLLPPAESVEMTDALPALADLPQATRQQLPELAISLHYYTAYPPARMVRINGRNLREGQRIEGEIFLEEVTAEGAILSYNEEKFLIRKQ